MMNWRIVLIPVIAITATLQAVIFDSFDEGYIDTQKWTVNLNSQTRHAQAIVKDSKLKLYGNGKWSFVESKKYWLIPQGRDGKITFTICINSWRKFDEENICDSGIWLTDRNNPKIRFGFGIFWRKQGKYSVLVGSSREIKVNQKVTANVKNANYLQIIVGRKNGKGFCEFQFSEDGKKWKTLYKRAGITLPQAVKLKFGACWGKLAVDFVEVNSTFNQISKSTPPANLSPDSTSDNYETLETFPVVYIPFIPDKTNVILDGKLNDKCWRNSAKVLLTQAPKGRPAPPTQKTYVYTFYDKNNLYIAYECFEDAMDKILVRQRTGTDVWDDDCVEVFLQPDIANQPDYIFHLAINPDGAKTDELGMYNFWQCGAKKYKNKWIVEIKLPFKTLGYTPSKGKSWKVNFYREERPHSEYQCWSAVRGSFHDNERFGFCIFDRTDAKLISSINLARAKHSNQNGLLIKLNKISGAKTIAVRWDAYSKEIVHRTNDNKTMFIPFPKLPAGKHKLILTGYINNREILSLSTSIRVISDSPLASTFWPTEDYDNTLYLTDCGMNFVFWLVNDTRGGKGGFTAVLEAPYWLEVSRPESTGEPYYRRNYSPKITSFRNEIIYAQDGLPLKRRITIISSTAPCGARSIAELNEWQAPFEIWFRPVLPKSIKPPYKTTIKFYVKRNGLTEPAHIMKTIILPKIEGHQPKHFPIFGWTNGPTFPRRLWARQLEYFSRIGLTGLQECPLNPEFERLARRYNITFIGSLWGWYILPDYIKLHPSSAAIDFDGKPSKRMVCPEVFLDDTSGAFALTFRRRTQNLAYCPPEGFNWDLEGPSVWKYCFCKRCIDAFKKYANLPVSLKLTPKKIKADKTLSRKWVDFVLDQNKRLIIKWDKAISNFRKGARLHINGGEATNPHLIYERMDWKRYIPYIGSAQMFRYCNSPQASATSFYKQSLKSLEILESVHTKTPIMAVLTTGYMRVSERLVFRYPELTTLQMLEMAGLGYKGIYYWHWYTNDGRFDSYISKGCTAIARYEKYFIDGRRTTLSAQAVKTSNKYQLVLARMLKGNLLLILLNFNPLASANIDIHTEKLPTKFNTLIRYSDAQKILANTVRIKLAPLQFEIIEAINPPKNILTH